MLDGVWANWFRLWIPSWRFFDEVGSAPKIFFQIRPRGEVTGDSNTIWEPLQDKPGFRAIGLFFNPSGNIYHCRSNLIERLALESQIVQSTELENSTSYLILADWVRSNLKPLAHDSEFEFRFKLTVLTISGDGQAHDTDVLASTWMTA